MPDTFNLLRQIADEQGWDEYTLLVQICQALDDNGQSQIIIETINGQIEEE